MVAEVEVVAEVEAAAAVVMWRRGCAGGGAVRRSGGRAVGRAMGACS